MIFAYPPYEGHGEKLPATHWYYQVDNRWIAVDKDMEDAFGWFDELDPAEGPEVREYPIDQTPPSGLLVFVDVSGVVKREIEQDKFSAFTQRVAQVRKDGDVTVNDHCVRCGHASADPEDPGCLDGEHRYETTYTLPREAAWNTLTALVGEARALLGLPARATKSRLSTRRRQGRVFLEREIPEKDYEPVEEQGEEE